MWSEKLTWTFSSNELKKKTNRRLRRAKLDWNLPYGLKEEIKILIVIWMTVKCWTARRLSWKSNQDIR